MVQPGRPAWLVDEDITGAEGITAEATFEPDYGRMLDCLAPASGNALGLATLRSASTNQWVELLQNARQLRAVLPVSA
jgi:hypothetical protein